MCVRMQRGTRRGNVLRAVSWTACSTTDRSTPLSPAIRHHCSLMWTHGKHQWELNSRHCRTPLYIFWLYRTDYSKSCYFGKRFTRQSYWVEARLVVLLRRMKGDILHYRTMDSTIRLHGLVTCLENRVVCFVFLQSCLFFKAFFLFLQCFLLDVTPSFAAQHFLLATPRKTRVVSLHWLTNGQQ